MQKEGIIKEHVTQLSPGIPYAVLIAALANHLMLSGCKQGTADRLLWTPCMYFLSNSPQPLKSPALFCAEAAPWHQLAYALHMCICTRLSFPCASKQDQIIIRGKLNENACALAQACVVQTDEHRNQEQRQHGVTHTDVHANGHSHRSNCFAFLSTLPVPFKP
eukprot:1154628-Pelagomonas_calceolata.AAC.3